MTTEILVGVDDSAPGGAAIEWASQRAEQLKCPLTLVHAVHDYWVSEKYAYYTRVMDSARGVLEKSAARVSEMAPSIRVQTRLHYGEPVRILSKLSETADMVVVGTDKTSAGGDGLLGSVSLQIAIMSVCPVAVIPVQYREDRSGVVVGVDGSPESLKAVTFAAAEADRIGQDLHAFYGGEVPGPWLLRDIPEADVASRAWEDGNAILTEAVSGLDGLYPDLRVHQRIESREAPATALIAAASKAQLLVIGSRGRGALKSIMMGKVGHNVLMRIPCPTVITRTATVQETPPHSL
ncbi:universal stress protein [Arthrobacter sp. H5]|uniref:universal stress protein n=1 Tax=Arthrobacter sp. H5 TaxID=1267973 RepID=UPI0012DC9FF9|nr:universal stress protein [Arthrobacter sp. H5]